MDASVRCEALNNQMERPASLAKDLQILSIRNHVTETDMNNVNCEDFGKRIVDLSYNNRMEGRKSGREGKEDGRCWHSNHRKKSEAARERWKILAKALLKPKRSSSKLVQNRDISVRRFTTFELIVAKNLEKLEKLEDCWLRYTTRIGSVKYWLEVHHLQHAVTARDLIGFNNTGNICIWPSEEVLTYYLLTRLDLVEGKRVLELGGGMTCLAGLASAKYGRPKAVHLTDGNRTSVANVAKMVHRNQLESRASAFVLEWSESGKVNETYDLVLTADCLFFDDVRSHLVATIWRCLAATGVALVLAPRRGNTFDRFVKEALQRGFVCVVNVLYNDQIWKQHLHFKETDPNYLDDLHYPILLILSKPDPLV